MMNNNKIGVAIIDNSLNPLVYDPVEHWSSFLRVPWTAFRAPDGILPAAPGDFTHVILTGSEASIIHRDQWVEEEVKFVREAAGRGIPLLGSCYGHQLLAIALAGSSHVRRCHRPEIGWLPIHIRAKDPLLGEAGEFHAYTLHFDEVIDLGDEFQILAETKDCLIHAFRSKNNPFWGIQAHPEIDIPHGRKLFRNLIETNTFADQMYENALNSIPRDSGLIRSIIDGFLNMNCST